MNLAPIILFVYNRPWHTQLSVEALQKCELATESDLYIFADGPKEDASNETQQKIAEVRKYIHSIDGFKSIHIQENTTNKGLANSVIQGVSEVIEKHGKVIVVEDDIVAHPFFLRFMNEALTLYQENKKIFTIGGTSINIDIPSDYPYDVFIAPRVESWGWATWKDRWQPVNWDTKTYPILKHATPSRIKLLCKGGDDFWPMLKSQVSGEVDSWAVRWQYNMTLQNRVCLFPVYSFVENIGFDNTGTNCGDGSVLLRPLYDKNQYDIHLVNKIKRNNKITHNLQRIYHISSPNTIITYCKRIKKRIKAIIINWK